MAQAQQSQLPPQVTKFIRESARGRRVHRIWLFRPGREVQFGISLYGGEAGQTGVFIQDVKEEYGRPNKGFAQATGRFEKSDQILSINSMLVDRRMTAFKVNRLMNNLMGHVDVIYARGEWVRARGAKSNNHS